MALAILKVQGNWVRGQDILSDSLAIRIRGPMKRSALAIVQGTEGNFVLEIQEHVNFIILGGKMKGVEASFGLSVDVGSLLMKVFYGLQVTHVGCV